MTIDEKTAVLKAASLADLAAELASRGVTLVPPGTEFLSALRAANLSRLVRFGHGDIKAPHGWGPMQWGCALAGEAGEFQAEIGNLNKMVIALGSAVGKTCNELKKYSRQMPTDPAPDELIPKIGDELADVFIYGDLCAAYFAMDIPRIVSLKFNRTSKKFGFPERL